MTRWTVKPLRDRTDRRLDWIMETHPRRPSLFVVAYLTVADGITLHARVDAQIQGDGPLRGHDLIHTMERAQDAAVTAINKQLAEHHA